MYCLAFQCLANQKSQLANHTVFCWLSLVSWTKGPHASTSSHRHVFLRGFPIGWEKYRILRVKYVLWCCKVFRLTLHMYNYQKVVQIFLVQWKNAFHLWFKRHPLCLVSSECIRHKSCIFFFQQMLLYTDPSTLPLQCPSRGS